MIDNKVVVWGKDCVNTLGLLRQIGASSEKIDLLFLIVGTKKFAYKSKYCQKYVETKSLEEGLNFLVEHYSGLDSKTIILTSGDDVVVFMDSHSEQLKEDFILPISNIPGNVTKYTDKNNMTDLASRLGILCPKSSMLKKNGDIPRLEYPCFIKPAHEKKGKHNEFKFKVCKSEKDLKKLRKFMSNDSEFIVQEYIENRVDCCLNAVRFLDGSIQFHGSTYTDRRDLIGLCSHGYIEANIPTCIDISKITDFINEVGFYGLFSVEFGIRDGKAYFFEVNFRNDGASYCTYQAGVNLPLSYIYSCANQAMEIERNYQKQSYINELFDYENVLVGKISKCQWKNELNAATIFKYYDEDDIEPYNIVKKAQWKIMARDVLVSKFRVYVIKMFELLGIEK